MVSAPSCYTLSVVISFPLSSVKASEVLERWWKVKGERKRYMREYRKKSQESKGG